MKPRILIVDDNKDLARGVALVLSELAEDIAVFHSAREALDAGATLTPDVVCSDVRMPGMDGLELLDTVRERWPHARMILFTAFGTIDAAVDSMKRGAFHYLTKPFNDDELLMLVRRAWKERCDELELTQLREEVHGRTCFHNLHSRDRRMVPVIDTIRKVAPSPTTVLICGESGTGKELVARAIHAESNRKSGPFVAFNAAALSESLAEAELFGARRGAYTSADKDRKGLFVEAQGGTLLLVSHSMYHIQHLCKRACWIKAGRIQQMGDVFDVTQAYLAYHEQKSADLSLPLALDPLGYEVTQFTINDDGNEHLAYPRNATLTLRVELRAPDRRQPNVAFGVLRADGTAVYGTTSKMESIEPARLSEESFAYLLELSDLALLPGTYHFRAHAMDPEGLRVFDTVAKTVVIRGESREFGIVHLAHRWLKP